MKRHIVQIRAFTKAINEFIDKKKVLHEDFEAFKKNLVENPEEGDLISGTGGVRKTRLKSQLKVKAAAFGCVTSMIQITKNYS